MDGTIWLLLWTISLGFIIGYRFGIGQASSGIVSALGFGNGQSPTVSRRKEPDPICHETVPVDHTNVRGNAAKSSKPLPDSTLAVPARPASR